MTKSDKRNLCVFIFAFYGICGILFCFMIYLNNKRAINTFENVVKNSEILVHRYGKIKKIKFKNPLNYGKSVDDEYIMKIVITNQDNKSYQIDIIDGSSTNSIVGYIINKTRYDEYESFDIKDYKKEIEKNNLDNINIGKFTNYKELFQEVNKLAIELYGNYNYSAYRIYYDRNSSVYMIQVYSSEITEIYAFLIHENGKVLSSFII